MGQRYPVVWAANSQVRLKHGLQGSLGGNDDGDLARHLRRTIDLLAQIPKLPDIDPMLQNTAKTASNIMDCPPISELTR